jgi:type IV secretion system protein TrbI
MSDLSSNPNPAGNQVYDRTPKPPGVIPKYLRPNWVIAAISLVMVAIIATLGGKNPQSGATKVDFSETKVLDASGPAIKNYQKQVAEELKAQEYKLAQERQAADQAKQQALAMTANVPTGPVSAAVPYQSAPYPARYSPYEAEPDSARSAVEKDMVRREYAGRFANSLVKTYRNQPPAQRSIAPELSAAQPLSEGKKPTALPASSRGLGSVALASPDEKISSNSDEDGTGRTAEDASANKVPSYAELSRADWKPYLIAEGTFIETVLSNRLDSSFSGPVNCQVTTDVYSRDGRHVLIPKGTRVLGEVKRVDHFGQQRLAVVFHRILMPDGYSLSLDRMQGLNQVGETGLQDQINHHYVQVFGVSLAIGAIAGLSAAETQNGTNPSFTDIYRAGVAGSLSQSSLHILDRYLNVLPTITIREGHRVKIYLARDLYAPAYSKHQMPSDL